MLGIIFLCIELSVWQRGNCLSTKGQGAEKQLSFRPLGVHLAPHILEAPSSMDSSAHSYHTFMDYMDYKTALPGIIVPQAVYSSTGHNSTQPPIRFATNGVPGVHLLSALSPNYNGVMNANQPVPFPNNEGKMAFSMCMQWPGYPSVQKKFPIPDKMNNGQFTYRIMAMIVARMVQQCMAELARPGMQSAERSADWWASEVSFDSLWLLELRHVSTGLWQPVLYRVV